jgi:hypothetical protein
MTYKFYKEKLSEREFFKKWDSENYKQLTESLKKAIYDKYLMKCEVFKRDNYKCQNLNCLKTGTSLTLHHIKWKKNGGKNTSRNGVTLCKTCHDGYHKAKMTLQFPYSKNLPSHFRGNTFRLIKPDNVDWKKVKSEMKILRKRLKDKCGIVLTWEQISILMRWLEVQYDEFND